MHESEPTTEMAQFVQQTLPRIFAALPLTELASVDRMEVLARQWSRIFVDQLLGAWKSALKQATMALAGPCPQCGCERKCKTRRGQEMKVHLLGHTFELPKLYLECGHCDAPSVSITRVLTGLSSGDKSAELRLMSAYSAADHSYGKASRNLEAHHGETAERTAIRRMALEVEQQALVFAEQQRQQALSRVKGEQRTVGPERLMLQGDGGSVRTGTLQPCERGDAGFGKKTAKTGRIKRKRVTQNREVITLDVRVPGEMQPSALDVVVPVAAKENERVMRMLALAARRGLGDNTQMLGLGDLGSQLPQSFDEAFVGYNALYSGDWKHSCNYVDDAAAVLVHIDARRWAKRMKDALWNRDERKRDKTLAQAHEHRVRKLPDRFEKCPVQALDTYVHNNWKYVQAARLKEMGVDFVSARAEAQVRDRTKARFRGPGAWREENLEGKATLRAIIADGRWALFRAYYLDHKANQFEKDLRERLRKAIADGRLSACAADCLSNPPETATIPAQAA